MAYVQSKEEKDLRAKGTTYAESAEKSNYSGKHNQTAEKALYDYQNMGPFQYDATSDALYQQYKDTYTKQGKLAMQDTMGQAAAMTGGYGNSYAQSVGQQTYNQYMGALADKIPELYELAYSKYRDKKSDLYNTFGMATQLDETEYSRDADRRSSDLAMAQYYTGLADSAYNRGYGEYMDEQQFNLTREQNDIANKQWQQQFDYNKEQNAIANAREDASMLAQGFKKNADGSWDYSGSGDTGSSLTFEEYQGILDTVESMKAEGKSAKEIGDRLNSYEAGGYLSKDEKISILKDLYPNAQVLSEEEIGKIKARNGWSKDEWTEFFTTICNSEGKDKAIAEWERMRKNGFIPENMLNVTNKAARGL